MVKWIIISVVALLAAAATVSMSVWSQHDKDMQRVTASEAVHGESRAAFKAICSMGNLVGVMILSNGPGVFQFNFAKDECDKNDRI